MLLVFDVGNTNIKLGLFENEDLVMIARTSTDESKTGDELALEIKGIFEVYGFDIAKVEGTIISSVVPQVLSSLKKAVKLLFKMEPLVVGPGLKTGINLKIDNPASAGADLVTGCVGAAEMYKLPSIVISMGTATTVFVIDEDKSMIGGAIIPGVGTALNALVKQGALLPSVAIHAPSRVVGKNTDECMRSGIVIGSASMIDGMIDRIEEEIGKKCSLVATGGLAAEIVPSCRHKIELRDDLMLQGLRLIFEKNKK
ncbi:MAG: type III pantothenate kinase [Clostridia bacterium]|nr:type III pantothenate kinase [Clostridia bacterium]